VEKSESERERRELGEGEREGEGKGRGERALAPRQTCPERRLGADPGQPPRTAHRLRKASSSHHRFRATGRSVTRGATQPLRREQKQACICSERWGGTAVITVGSQVARWMHGTHFARQAVIRRLNGKPRPELDIDLYHGHPTPETRIWDRRSGQVVDGSGPMQDFPLGA
jgi:hypothetical protein